MTLIRKNMTVDLYTGPNKVINPVYVTPKEMILYLETDKDYRDVPEQDKKLIADIAKEQIRKGKHDACFIVHITHSYFDGPEYFDTQKCTYIQYRGTVKYTD